MLMLAVASGKGGVGKSTIAALLAVAFKNRGAHVALLDTDIYGPSIPTIFGIQGARHTFDSRQRINPICTHDIEIVSFGCIIGDMPAIMRGPMAARYIEQLLTHVNWRTPDILIIDMPPGSGDVHLTITQSVALDGALLVSTPHTLSYADVGRTILMFNKVKVPVLGLIENMSFFECPTCHTLEYLFGEGADRILQRRFGLSTLVRLPLSRQHFGEHPLSEPLHGDIAPLTEAIQRALEREATRPAPLVKNSTEGIQIILGEQRLLIPHRTLRNDCQCALCVDEVNGRRIAAPVRTDVHAQEIKLVGNYALYIRWSDGHTTGFFPFDRIERLAQRSDAGGDKNTGSA